MTLTTFTFALVAVGVLCFGLPWAVACLLVPALQSSPAARTRNWRGADVVLGLGAVWTVWGGCALLAGWLLGDLGASAASEVIVVAGVLSIITSAFGLVDDAYGSRDVRGFSGHVRALLEGSLTTGGLKLVGIGVASLAAARAVAGVASWGGSPAGILVAGVTVALTANFVNLLDLRPGRALKGYVALSCAGALLLASFVYRLAGAGFASSASLLAVALLGPAAACWRYDLGERAMLGDAGANAMGAVAGLVIVSALPLPGVAAFGAAVLALNLLSERVSFSAVIERVGVLAWLDALGRASAGTDDAQEPHDEGASRYDGNDSAGGSREV
ncbi:hypothetical protein MX659_05945 [Coriobacteriia bacterium Es71-Z0120]|uniref:hypothetical protein n=1 Tax=Parvivirga hydrogeniphila TaxID=2939460 RepID=UPI002260C97A|nr:hypothetical protein [Parvivirga hydrogeniphila]MCL4079126.1 hypothetical protein [Parvivirga hydrogeniphila]